MVVCHQCVIPDVIPTNTTMERDSTPAEPITGMKSVYDLLSPFVGPRRPRAAGIPNQQHANDPSASPRHNTSNLLVGTSGIKLQGDVPTQFAAGMITLAA